jgi:hypothetical protein
VPRNRLARRRERGIAAADREQQLGQLVEVGRLHVAAERVAAQDRLEHGICTTTREQRAAEPLERLLLCLGRVDVARDQRRRERDVVELRPALQLERARLRVVEDDVARVPPGRRVAR